MSTNVLLLGRTGIVLDNIKTGLGVQDVTLFGGTSLEDVQSVFDKQKIDIVIMGAGIDLTTRLNIISHIFTTSNSTTVHMKDWNSGPQGMLPFVNSIITGLIE